MPEKLEIAHWLLTTASTTGALYTAAKVIAEWKSPSAVAPSPTQPMQMRLSPLIAAAIDQPTACGNCVAGLPEIGKKPCALAGYMIGSWRPLSFSALFEYIWFIISVCGSPRAI